jgi:hypothetical protein
MSEYDDPEQSYRRGYLQGAQAILDAMDRGWSSVEIRNWLQSDLTGWRMNNLRGKSDRHPLMGIDQSIAPPPVRNSN